MDASELGRWTRFAGKGGIGKCTALQDCIAEEPQDLMFMKVSTLLQRWLSSLLRRSTSSPPRICLLRRELIPLTHTLCLGASMHMLQVMRAPV
ncbi:hypothetical protein K466DRAFT_507927 [Polyporus arcularius HHB13444]|uniref:Uncharacterized protein n=1 Tax=Polyporus arcularius HHB13444 TaxID=1314778 RepID=A0A5C3NKE5_9APHY|nr:hypothetical protein K466DRAFT_507927 [Polyporus arcularius HHB13444]